MTSQTVKRKTLVLLALRVECIREYLIECSPDEFLAVTNCIEITDYDWMDGFLKNRFFKERKSGDVSTYYSTVHLFFIQDNRKCI